MKRLIFCMLVVALGTTSIFAYPPNPDTEPKVLINTSDMDSRVMKYQLANLRKMETTVVLENLQGERLYREVIREHNGHVKRINLQQVPNGRYILRVEHDDDTYQVVVKLEADSILFSRVSD